MSRKKHKYLFTSDWHIQHKNILSFCDRGVPDLDAMHQKLVDNYNSLADHNTIGYFLGDMCFDTKAGKEVLAKLNGTKILIRGNHDYKPSVMEKTGFDAVFEEATLIIAGRHVKLSHFPYKPETPSIFSLQYYKDIITPPVPKRYLSRRPYDQGGWLLHGHTHSKEKVKNKMIHVGVEAWDMVPVTVPQLESIMGKYEREQGK